MMHHNNLFKGFTLSWNMEQFALLTLYKKRLEVKVDSDERDVQQELKRLSSLPGEKPTPVRGCIRFEDGRGPIEIIKDFARTYHGGGEPMVQSQGEEFATVDYHPDFEQFITLAFFDYFGKI